jgi:anti-sigma-K factor RskA
MKYSDPHLVDSLSAAYVLGTLRGAARRRFERLRNDRSDVKLVVALWESRLGRLAQTIPAARPSPRVWAAVQARTRPQAERKRTGATGSTAPAKKPGSLFGWLKPAGFGLGGLATGLIAASAMFTIAPALFVSTDQVAMRAGEKLPQSYVGLLTDAQGNGKLLVSSLRQGRTMTIKVIGPITPPAAGKLVLWAVPPNGEAFALGPVPVTGSAVSRLPDTSEKLLSKVSKLLVTVETTDNPVVPGTVVFSGNCAKLW